MTKGHFDSWERRGLGEDDSDCRLSFVACSSSLPFFFFWVKNRNSNRRFFTGSKKAKANLYESVCLEYSYLFIKIIWAALSFSRSSTGFWILIRFDLICYIGSKTQIHQLKTCIYNLIYVIFFPFFYDFFIYIASILVGFLFQFQVYIPISKSNNNKGSQ